MIQGGSPLRTIRNGASDDQEADGPSFEDVPLGAALSNQASRTYTIYNNGSGPLTVSAISLGYQYGCADVFSSDASNAAVIGTAIQPEQSANFTINYSTTKACKNTNGALVSVLSNDLVDGNYTFVIAGRTTFGLLELIPKNADDTPTNLESWVITTPSGGVDACFATDAKYVFMNASTGNTRVTISEVTTTNLGSGVGALPLYSSDLPAVGTNINAFGSVPAFTISFYTLRGPSRPIAGVTEVFNASVVIKTNDANSPHTVNVGVTVNWSAIPAACV